MMKVQTAGQAQFPNHLRMLVVGDHYSGKTTLAQTAPNPLFLMFGNADRSALAEQGTRFVELTTESDIMELKDALGADPGEVDYEKTFGGPVDTIVLDTVDELQRVLLVNRLNNDRRINTSREDWGWLGIRMNAILRGLSSLDLNIIYLSNTKVDEHNRISPGLQGAFVDQIHNFVDISALLTVEPMAPEDPEGPDIGDAESDLLSVEGQRNLFLRPLERATWVGSILDFGVISGGGTIEYIMDEMDSLREKLPASNVIGDLAEEEESVEVEIPGMSSDAEIAEVLNTK